jgi:hypothetical protein
MRLNYCSTFVFQVISISKTKLREASQDKSGDDGGDDDDDDEMEIDILH